ncbi:hypothetical protein FDECE_489 [Fusarium decemcellulare]|nr:hypothetical protein FDECE_489 [Fusarium decemcellulare]
MKTPCKPSSPTHSPTTRPSECRTPSFLRPIAGCVRKNTRVYKGSDSIFGRATGRGLLCKTWRQVVEAIDSAREFLQADEQIEEALVSALEYLDEEDDKDEPL